MKRISHKQSRKNSAARQRKVRARHAKAGRWTRQVDPMFGSGKIHYEIGARPDAMSHGGIGAVHRLVTKLGLVKKIDEGLQLLKVHLPYHESDHVLNMAYNVLCGGTRLEDIERLRHDPAYMNALGAELIPDPTTAGDFCRRFTEGDVVELMECINSVRPQLWSTRARDLLGRMTYVDVEMLEIVTAPEAGTLARRAPALGDTVDIIRLNAAEALGRLGDTSGARPLASIVHAVNNLADYRARKTG